MDMFYIIWHDGRRGIGPNAYEAINAALGQVDFNSFMDKQPNRGYLWTGYVPRRFASDAKIPPHNLQYETTTINHQSKQLCEVFKTQSIKVIQLLTKKYGNAKQLRTGFILLTRKATIIVPSKAKPTSK